VFADCGRPARGAAWNIMQGWCSDDSFFYFQPWLVGLGQDAFEQVSSNVAEV
jgi:hypothetical protein